MSFLRKLFLFGLGATSMSKENVKKFFDEMVERGEMSSSEAKNCFDDWMKKGEEEREEFSARISAEMEKLRLKLGLVTLGDLENLKQRIDHLESKLSEKIDNLISKNTI
jgi:polyhydroxyalkanoate synthesis regulator phasin